ncbi:Glycosyl transferase, family 25 [actinobacterium SCGC AAA044-D11]
MSSILLPKFFILGVRNKFRGFELFNEIERQGGICQIQWAQTFEEIENYHKTSLEFQNFTIGRRLKFEEISCALGHNEIYQLIWRQGLTWAVVLEDDVQVVNELQKLSDYLFQSDEPTIIFLNSFSLKVSHENVEANHKIGIPDGLRKQFLPKNIACSYAINFAAVDLILKLGRNNLLSVADWPYIWFTQVHFYQIEKPFFSHSNDANFSIIGNRNTSREKFSMRIPNPIRLIRAILFDVPIRIAIKNEVLVKAKLLYLQVKFKIGKI